MSKTIMGNCAEIFNSILRAKEPEQKINISDAINKLTEPFNSKEAQLQARRNRAAQIRPVNMNDDNNIAISGGVDGGVDGGDNLSVQSNEYATFNAQNYALKSILFYMLRQYFDNASVSVAELLQLRTRPEWNIMEPLRDQLISLKYFDTINNICKYKQNQIASITKHLNQLESKLYFDEQLIKVEPNDNMDTSSDNNNNNSSQISVVDLLSQESQSNIKIEPSGMSSLIQQTQYSNVSQFTNNDNDDDSEVMNDMIPKPTHGLMNIWNPNNIASGQQNNIIVSETQSSNISHIASPIKFNNFQNEPYIRSSLSIPTQLAQQMNTADDSPTGPQHTPPAFGAPTTP
eukprot:282055_1